MKIYDELSEWYDIVYGLPKGYDEVFVDYLDKLFKIFGVKKVLDCACGTGNPSIGLILKGYQVISSDFNQKMLERAKINASKQGITLTTYVADWRELPSKINDKFDAIVLTGNSFYHLDNDEDRLTVLRNFYRLLKKGGICYIDYDFWDIDAIIREGRFKLYGVYNLGEKNIIAFRIYEYDFEKSLQILKLFIISEEKGEAAIEKIIPIPGWMFETEELFGITKKAGFSIIKPASRPGVWNMRAMVAIK